MSSISILPYLELTKDCFIFGEASRLILIFPYLLLIERLSVTAAIKLILVFDSISASLNRHFSISVFPKSPFIFKLSASISSHLISFLFLISIELKINFSGISISIFEIINLPLSPLPEDDMFHIFFSFIFKVLSFKFISIAFSGKPFTFIMIFSRED